MEEVEAEQISEQEALASLVTLAGPLQWSEQGPDTFAATLPGCDYWLFGSFADPEFDKEFDEESLIWSAWFTATDDAGEDKTEPEGPEYAYPTVEAAQTACERHRATGKWESMR